MGWLAAQEMRQVAQPKVGLCKSESEAVCSDRHGAERQSLGASRLRVTMVTGAYYPEISGGATHCRSLIRALRGTATFTVITTARDSGLPRREQVDGVSVWRVHVPTAAPWQRLRALSHLVQAVLIASLRSQVLHLQGFTLKSMLALLIAKALRKRTLVTLHTAGQDEPLAQRARWFGRLRVLIYRRADRFVTVSTALSTGCLEFGLPRRKLVEIPNGVDTTRFRPPVDPEEKAAIRARLGLPADLPMVLFVGIFSADKGPHHAVEAWLRIREKRVRSLLVMVGSTDTRYFEIDPAVVGTVRRLVASPAADGDARLVESTLEMEAYCRASDLFVLPSRREAFPLALLEAMASGLPCVVSRLPGATDSIVEDRVNGLLVAPGDVEGLALGMVEILENPARGAALGHAARAMVQSRYTVDRMAAAYLDCYRELA